MHPLSNHTRVWRNCFTSLLAAALMLGPACAEPLPDDPTPARIFSACVLPEPLVPSGHDATEMENRALAKCLNRFQNRTGSDDFSALENFATANPTSPWRLAILTNLGLLQYRVGYFSRCLLSFRAAWDAGKNATDLKAKALADRAVGGYTKMLASK